MSELKNILVTGGSGFIGGYVTRLLLSKGCRVTVLDRRVKPPGERIPGTDVFLGDVRDEGAVTEAVSTCDGVMHLAGVLGTQETVADPRVATETNVMGSLNVFRAVRTRNVRCVYITVGNHWMNNPYSISKTASERPVVLCQLLPQCTPDYIPISQVAALESHPCRPPIPLLGRERPPDDERREPVGRYEKRRRTDPDVRELVRLRLAVRKEPV